MDGLELAKECEEFRKDKELVKQIKKLKKEISDKLLKKWERKMLKADRLCSLNEAKEWRRFFLKVALEELKRSKLPEDIIIPECCKACKCFNWEKGILGFILDASCSKKIWLPTQKLSCKRYERKKYPIGSKEFSRGLNWTVKIK